MVLLVHPSVPANIRQRADRHRQEGPGKLNYASAGPGSGIHLATELFASMAGIRLTHVALSRAPRPRWPTCSAATSTSISARCRRRRASPRGQGARAGRDGREALQRAARRADRGRSGAAGLRGGTALWHCGTGRHAALHHRQAQCGPADALEAEDTRELLVATGAEPLPSTPEEYAADIDAEEAKWSRLVKQSGVKAN